MIKARFIPLDLKDFPSARNGADRVMRCPFKSSYPRTLDLLEKELRRFNAEDIEIHAGFTRNGIRNDGMPMATAKPVHPAVILRFRDLHADREYSFPCDMFAVYQVNLHAIALTLSHLRGVERYGVAQGNQQYAGFLQLEAPRKMSVDEAAEWLASIEGIAVPYQITADPGLYNTVRRHAAKRLHPDANPTPSDGRWEKLAEVKALLDKHHGLTATQVAR